MTETERRNKACNQARAWLGKKEADGSHREIIDVYNKGRGVAPPIGYNDPWCAAFVSAVGIAAGLPEILPGINCDAMIDAYRKRGQWVENDAYIPKPADLVFYDWQDSGVGDNTGSSDHVGLVVEVNEHYMTVIEGNKSNMVGTRTLAINSRYIRGFATPGYASRAATLSQNEASAENGTSVSAVIVDKPEGAVSAAEMGQDAAEMQREESCQIDLPVLHQGMTGEAVRAAQLLLIGRGFRCGPWGADGDFGYATYGAVRRFQKAKNLLVDGVVGKQTWTRLLLG